MNVHAQGDEEGSKDQVQVGGGGDSNLIGLQCTRDLESNALFQWLYLMKYFKKK